MTEEIRSEKERAKMALYAQDACNLSGVLQEFLRLVIEARAIHGDFQSYKHDYACLLVFDKIMDMMGHHCDDRYNMSHKGQALDRAYSKARILSKGGKNGS